MIPAIAETGQFPLTLTLVYDADGNLTFHGVWDYTWDAENRSLSMNMTTVSGIANSNRLRLDFGCHSMNRRVSKTVSSWNGAVSSIEDGLP